MQWSPLAYKAAAVVAREVSNEMINRLDFMTLKPEIILDIGCGSGEDCGFLHKKYPNAKIFGVDLSAEMLASFNNMPNSLSLMADAKQLPFRTQSVDLIYANFLYPWLENPEQVLQEWQRLLKPEGLLVFTALGPDTLEEWRQFLHEHELTMKFDMHDIGDKLLHLFSDPVLDVEHYTVCFQDKKKMFTELIASGLYRSAAMNQLDDITDDLPLEANFEVIFAHAFGKAQAPSQKENVTKISLDSLRQQLKNS